MRPTEAHRHFYAQLVVRSAESSDERLVAAFSSVPRENYVGKGPWPVFVGAGCYLQTISDDPYLLYQDILIGLAPERGINNGEPSLHARCLAAAAPTPGETVVHIGAGTGYYTAILAHLVTPSGRVVAYEIEGDLADKARTNLSDLPAVAVVTGSATDSPLPSCDLIYVNAGATHPHPLWLDALNVGGRLIFPLTPNEGLGCILLITRRESGGYAATVVTRAAFIPCIGARDDATSDTVATALETRSVREIRSLRRDGIPDETAWCAGEGWWLSTADAA
jgi:protein-L-isoaspartate(D-aspartate) O-methyltransferase